MTEIRITPLSKLFSCSGRWIRDLVQKGILDGPKKGVFHLESAVEKYIKFLRSSNPNEQYQKLRGVHLNQRIVKLKLETKAFERTLVPACHAQEVINKAAAAFELAFQNMPWRVAEVLVRVKDAYGKDADYEKFCAVLLDRMFKDMMRENFSEVRQETPVVNPWDIDLLRVGAIEPDKNGEVIFTSASRPFKRKVKVNELLREATGPGRPQK